MNKAGNIRHRETEARLQKALLDLLEKKSLKDITVRELCEAVRINKATFYRHYQDIYGLTEGMEQCLVILILFRDPIHNAIHTHTHQLV